MAILGLPYDGSASLRAGAAGAPVRLREISRTSDPIDRHGRLIDGLRLRDYGDVVPAGPPEGTRGQRDFLEVAATAIGALPSGALTLVVGGDNSVSIAALEAFGRRHGPDAGVIWFDAHPDLFETYDGNPDSHACALRTGMRRGGLSPRRCVLLGTRSFSCEERRFIEQERVEVITSSEWLAGGIGAVAERIGDRLAGSPAVYWAVDIDGFDASCAPGTGYPMPGGVGSEPFFLLQERLFGNLPIRAMDVTEIAPPLDHNDMTSFLGVQVILEALGSLKRA